MNKNKILRVINPIQFLLLINQIATGIFHESIPYNTYEIVHEGAGLLLGGILLLHLYLNWDWVKNQYFKKKAPAEPAK